MNTLRTYLCLMMMLTLTLSGVPAFAGDCTHDKAPTSIAQVAEPPCPMHAEAVAQTAAASQTDTKTMDCCGDGCSCALGGCHSFPAYLGNKSGDALIFDSAVLTIAAAHGLTSFHPEQATPPPRV